MPPGAAQGATATTMQPPQPHAATFTCVEMYYRSVRELAVLVRTGELSAAELLELHLERIAAVNPKVNAIVTLDVERARREAAAADRALHRGADVGPLHGLPVAFKDTEDTAGMRTTSGSPLLVDNVPATDELVVERVRAAGAVIVGKTNVPEFAAGSNTFNTVFGATRNPYDLSRSAGGSSGGAAAALASGMVPLASGSDMGGSLRNPASFCNVVGLRPSPGRVPTHPAALAWQTLAVQGPLGRTVDDVAMLLSVMAGPDPRAPLSLAEPGSAFRRPLERDLNGLRVAYSFDLGGAVPVDREVVDALTAQLQVFTDLGCRVEPACLDFTGADEAFRTLRAWAFLHSFDDLVRVHPEAVKSAIIWNVEQGRRLSGADVARAYALQTELYHRARRFFDDWDVLLLPACQVAPFDLDLEYPAEVAGAPQKTYLDWMGACYLVTALAVPALSVPAGFTPAGLPVGLQIVGPHRGDRLLLEVAHAFESRTAFGERRPF